VLSVLAEVEKLGMLGTTAGEMAAWFGVALRTVERRMAKADGDFRRSYVKGFGRLKISLRRKQIESDKSGNVSMLIWLGKQLLDQVDKREVTQEATITEKVAKLTITPEDEEFLRRKEWIGKAAGMHAKGHEDR
jgi:hypothetical protein